MQILKLVMQSSLFSNGCKLYYQYLYNLYNASKKNNWMILDGNHKGNNFVIAKDSHACKQLNISRASVQQYKKCLKQFNLIYTLPKFTFKTNIGKNQYWHQATVLATKAPRKLIAKLLQLPTKIKKIKVVQAPNKIISQMAKNLNNKITQFSCNFSKKINMYFPKKRKYTNKKAFSKNISNNPNLNTVLSLLNKHDIPYKEKDINKYLSLFISNKSKFINVCQICQNKPMYAPVRYFSAVFNNISISNKFIDFPMRNHDAKYWEYLTNILVFK